MGPPPDLSSTVRGSPLRGYTRRGSPRTAGVVDRGGSTAGTRGVGATGAPESTLRGVCDNTRALEKENARLKKSLASLQGELEAMKKRVWAL